jgi:hypothetical protein
MSGYMACCLSVVVSALQGIIEEERLEVIFEHQPRYSVIAGVAMNQISKLSRFRLPDGRSKLAKWSFVPKHSTPLLEIADCLAYSQLQLLGDRESLRSRWTKRIRETNGGKCLGHRLNRDEVRNFVSGNLRAIALRKTVL